MGAKTVDEGINEQHLLEQATRFSAFKTNKVLSGRPEPLGVGELLFDETKVPVNLFFMFLAGNDAGNSFVMD